MFKGILHGKRRFPRGFTLIELLIVILIISIILGIAYPSYVDYVRKSKRGEAQQELLNWAVNQEIWRSSHSTYASTTDLAAPTGDNYTFETNGTPTATAYELEANATGDQVNDETTGGTSCAAMTLDQNGVKGPAACWK